MTEHLSSFSPMKTPKYKFIFFKNFNFPKLKPHQRFHSFTFSNVIASHCWWSLNAGSHCHVTLRIMPTEPRWHRAAKNMSLLELLLQWRISPLAVINSRETTYKYGIIFKTYCRNARIQYKKNYWSIEEKTVLHAFKFRNTLRHWQWETH